MVNSGYENETREINGFDLEEMNMCIEKIFSENSNYNRCLIKSKLFFLNFIISLFILTCMKKDTIRLRKILRDKPNKKRKGYRNLESRNEKNSYFQSQAHSGR